MVRSGGVPVAVGKLPGSFRVMYIRVCSYLHQWKGVLQLWEVGEQLPGSYHAGLEYLGILNNVLRR